MTYSEALEFINEGQCVSRRSWDRGNGERSMFICKQIPSEINGDNIMSLKSLPSSAKEVITNWKMDKVTYVNQVVLVSRDGFITQYIPSSEDLFATDWTSYI